MLISHDIGLVLRNADRVCILHDGRIVESGPPEDLAAAPKHPETRRLLTALAPLPRRIARPHRDPILTLAGASAAYANGRVRAIEGADLTVAPGEIVGVQGPSGCGKSTLLRLAMGIERPTGGQVSFAPALDQPGAIQPIFQNPVAGLVPRWPIWRSVAEPLTAPGRLRLPRSELRARAIAVLAEVGLKATDPEARPAELSVGQCQRVALARATLARPALIVADEPTSALDGPSTWRVSTLLSDAAESGAAVLVVSHDSTFLARLADRIVRMAEGRTLSSKPVPSSAAEPSRRPR
ncbi:ATP-binding cassette domain-containing protein [Jannaschia marina]|uniref:ATP-binding cassette domain-containing protein n=1 Tax=Jannaschia marina TaxID=2741674 RepID=UPI0015CE6722|nr:ATP-binding cassette domain-containing protein [Jannaschia marina]